MKGRKKGREGGREKKDKKSKKNLFHFYVFSSFLQFARSPPSKIKYSAKHFEKLQYMKSYMRMIGSIFQKSYCNSKTWILKRRKGRGRKGREGEIFILRGVHIIIMVKTISRKKNCELKCLNVFETQKKERESEGNIKV